jgi:hypothetical protein
MGTTTTVLLRKPPIVVVVVVVVGGELWPHEREGDRKNPLLLEGSSIKITAKDSRAMEAGADFAVCFIVIVIVIVFVRFPF